MIEFPITDLMDDQACYDFLLECLHPDGLHCPHGHRLRRRMTVTVRRSWTIAVGSVARCTTCSAVRSSPRAAIGVRPSCCSCVASPKAYPPSIWPPNSAWTAAI